MADVKGQVDWEEVAAMALNKTGADSWTHDKCEETLRTTFEPLVKAAEPLNAFIAKFDEHARAGLDDVLYSVDGDMDNGIKANDLRALRAALDALPKVGG